MFREKTVASLTELESFLVVSFCSVRLFSCFLFFMQTTHPTLASIIIIIAIIIVIIKKGNKIFLVAFLLSLSLMTTTWFIYIFQTCTSM